MIGDGAIWLSYGGVICGLLVVATGVLFMIARKKRVPLMNKQPPRQQRKRLPPIVGRVSRVPTMNEQPSPSRRQSGAPAPFVYNEATPWGWLEYRNGNFRGQELALKRALISIGRETDNEVELDDDTISRYHAELAWQQGQVYVTDNGSLNGVKLNGRRVRGSAPVKHGDLLGIGRHQFLMKFAQQPPALDEMDDPLLKYIRKPGASPHFLTPSAAGKPLAGPTRALSVDQQAAFSNVTSDTIEQETCELNELSGAVAPETLASPAAVPLNLPGQLRLPSRLIE